MKRFIISLLAILSALTSYAQEHMTFKGVPIDGTLDAYVANMKKAGFTYLGTQDGVAMLQGDFAGYRNCTIGVVTLKSIDVVNKIVVIFDGHDTWSNLYGNYSSLKDMLTTKYGKHNLCTEKFDGTSNPSDDSDRMHALNMERCKYFTVWETEKGSIELEIRKENWGTGRVTLSYWDKANTTSVQEKALEDL
jgi:hypothetical protein